MMTNSNEYKDSAEKTVRGTPIDTKTLSEYGCYEWRSQLVSATLYL